MSPVTASIRANVGVGAKALRIDAAWLSPSSRKSKPAPAVVAASSRRFAACWEVRGLLADVRGAERDVAELAAGDDVVAVQLQRVGTRGVDEPERVPEPHDGPPRAGWVTRAE
jgi:hypothetical protein